MPATRHESAAMAVRWLAVAAAMLVGGAGVTARADDNDTAAGLLGKLAEDVPLELASVLPQKNTDFGDVQLVAALILQPKDDDFADHFGGWSSVLASEDARTLLAVSDTGMWLTATLAYDAKGVLTGVDNAKVAPMQNVTDSGSIAGNKNWADAESLVSAEGGPWNTEDPVLVSFERKHRIWQYDTSPGGPKPHDIHPGVAAVLSQCRVNGGVEAAEVLSDGRLFAVCEHPPPESPDSEHVPGWLFENWRADESGRRLGVTDIWLPHDMVFSPTDAARLPHTSGVEHDHLLLLSRAYVEGDGDGPKGSAMRLSRVHLPHTEGGGVLHVQLLAELWAVDGYPIDNMEGLSVVPGSPAGVSTEAFATAFVMSDDNFNANEKTVLLQFALGTLSDDSPVFRSHAADGAAPSTDGPAPASAPKKSAIQSRTAVYVLVGGGAAGITLASALLAVDLLKAHFRRRALGVALDEIDEDLV